jgi:hypothetical protein
VNFYKIVGWVAIAICLVSAFTSIPRTDLILLVLGLVGGFAMASEDHVRVLVSAIALAMLSGVWMAIPSIGVYLTNIFSGLGTFAAGAALMIISRNVWRRYKP